MMNEQSHGEHGEGERVNQPFGATETSCVLIAGTLADLPAIRTHLAALPADSYGQVIIESCSPASIHEPLETPARVAVSWVAPVAEDIADWQGIGLVQAVEAWASEWLWVDGEDAREVHMWCGGAEHELVAEYWAALDGRIERRVSSRRRAGRPAPRSSARQLLA